VVIALVIVANREKIFDLALKPGTEAPESDGNIVKFGSRTVWNAPDGKWEEIHEKCSVGAGKIDLQCIASKMREAGASSEATAFTKQMKGEVYLSSFREMGKVDLAAMTYPLLNDPNVTTNIMVNGVPQMVDPWNWARNVDLRKDKNYNRIARRFPGVELWPMSEFETMQSLPQNGQRFILSFLLLTVAGVVMLLAMLRLPLTLTVKEGFQKRLY
jgi:hypothetical protein